ncbi:MAG: hypothetical protein IPO85_00190 [Saprospiraceae bacterium]|uniref:Uncharacterized protein n=1 Tax=Candidatus Defluviibacterium haderslevense TaxID=2981993 RepID=A0A9D7S5A7_9BACT|nr:hypothetical protein [Candidatus Defluviibacterium haderslevense]
MVSEIGIPVIRELIEGYYRIIYKIQRKFEIANKVNELLKIVGFENKSNECPKSLSVIDENMKTQKMRTTTIIAK